MTVDNESVTGSYLRWLRQELREEALDNAITVISTPFLDRHNDHLQIYVERQRPDFVVLTDDGYIIAELKSAGVETRGPKREELLGEILRAHGVQIERGELQVEAPIQRVGAAAHNLIQAMLSLDDMFVLAQPKVQDIFFEDVASFLDLNSVRYTPRVKFAGKSGLDHLVHFVIPRSKAAPERVLQVVTSPRRDRVESLLFAASDARAARGRDVQYIALVNDKQKAVPRDILDALEAYDVLARPWSRRSELVDELAA